MARSYRKPYSAITGTRSAKQDKRIAARGVRQAHRRWLFRGDWEDGPPLRGECPYNNVYSWARDGRQRYQAPNRCRHPEQPSRAETVDQRRSRRIRRFTAGLEEWYRSLLRK